MNNVIIMENNKKMTNHDYCLCNCIKFVKEICCRKWLLEKTQQQ